MKLLAEGVRRYWPTLLIIAGIVLLVYVGVQYGTMYAKQKELAQQWQQQNVNLPEEPAGLVTTLTRLTIPSIKLDAVVVEGTNRKALLIGPGHMESTPEPGDRGNVVITGHRDTFFRHVYELNAGDSILVQRAGREYRYQVTGKKIIAPDDLSVVRPTSDSQLTLITCYPTYWIGPAPKRLVVFSKLVDVRRNDEASPRTSPVAQTE
jgi:sortase A